MELKAFDILLCRTPVFSVQDDLEEKWDELKTMIRDSSPPLFEIIKDLDYPQLKSAGKMYVMEMLTTLFRAKLTTGLADFWVAANAVKACTKIVI